MSDTTDVKRTLARLAHGDTGGLGRQTGPFDGEDYRAVVDAASAVETLADAAEFVDAGGLDSLDDAIDRAAAAGDHAAARRGREARERLAELRSAVRECADG